MKDAFSVTESDETKGWNPRVRELTAFYNKDIKQHISFLCDVFYGRELKDYSEEKRKFSKDFQFYILSMSKLWEIEDLTSLKEVFALFDDEVLMPAPSDTRTAMKELCEASVHSASRKPDGIRILLDHLCEIPQRGYRCGCEGIVRLLLQKKYFDKFKMSIGDVTEDTRELLKRILEGLPDKRTVERRRELLEEI
ncbi:MAG: hypothetical protein NC092_07960 [Butyrivibrio sp.]|nr:hypothetical protein [Muribaculum sp.]MCM1552609.1 hypothetical protein [Butyrivibrio sp.]